MNKHEGRTSKYLFCFSFLIQSYTNGIKRKMDFFTV